MTPLIANFDDVIEPGIGASVCSCFDIAWNEMSPVGRGVFIVPALP
jgi:hypothetical protein